MWGVQGGHVYISISPSSCNYKQLTDTAYPEPFLNYILGGSVSISTCKFKVLAAAKMIDPKKLFYCVASGFTRPVCCIEDACYCDS